MMQGSSSAALYTSTAGATISIAYSDHLPVGGLVDNLARKAVQSPATLPWLSSCVFLRTLVGDKQEGVRNRRRRGCEE